MSRIFITGSSDGLGLAAARDLMAQGHEVVLHARSSQRAAVLSDLAPCSAGVVIGDLSSALETHAIAEQVNRMAGWTRSSTTQVSIRCRIVEGRPRGPRRSLRSTRLLPKYSPR